MYLSCLCAAIFFHLASGLTLASLTLDMLWTNEGCVAGDAVACCKIRGWNIICKGRKYDIKARFFFVFFSFTRKDLVWRDQMNFLTQQLQTSHTLWPGFHVVLGPQISTTDTQSRHVIFLFLFYTASPEPCDTASKQGGKAGRTRELGRKKTGRCRWFDWERLFKMQTKRRPQRLLAQHLFAAPPRTTTHLHSQETAINTWRETRRVEEYFSSSLQQVSHVVRVCNFLSPQNEEEKEGRKEHGSI